MIYKTDGAFRAGLEARLSAQSRDSGVDLNRLRRRVVFERALTRLDRSAPGRWVLKGGMALEVRWQDRARATRDLDLALRLEVTTAEAVREALASPLAIDVDEDRFRFLIGQPRSLRADQGGRPGWRLPVEARLAGREFASVSVDVVVRPDEVVKTERLKLPELLAFAGIPAGEVETIGRAQHFAEKLHALTRTYLEGPSSRVKDLVDLVLLIDDGLEPNAELLQAVSHIFASRATHDLPAELPDPPADWAARYAELTIPVPLSAPGLDEAMRTLRTFWRAVRSNQE